MADGKVFSNGQLLQWLALQQAEMLQRTIELASINSGSFNASGVNQVAELIKSYCQPLDGKIETIETSDLKKWNDQGELQHLTLGNILKITKRPNAPLQIYLGGHLDTVFDKTHHFQNITHVDSNTIQGPGVTDLKGGLMVMLYALIAFEKNIDCKNIGWTILLNPDEEIGSPGSAAYIEKTAKTCDIGLIYEPSFPDGNLAGARKGSGNFTAKVSGRSAHAGREHHLGRNAIRAMADFISQLDDLNGQVPGITINPGVINGGVATNVVPDLCLFQFNIRLEKLQDQQWCQQKIQQLVEQINARDGITLELQGGFTRQPKLITPKNKKLFELAIDCGKSINLNLDYLPTGGCCDGNNLSAVGLPNIDTLGVQGGRIHSDQEYLIINSLHQRAQLSLLILQRLAATADQWNADRQQRCRP
ncbi:hydrolase [Pelagibaculum spongiae]|uniref:Peptidase M20 dimerisation domain-containing protein n=1 Tax=Pelagibaculum spongiae TaxID=2080658 RepID=A0A2V1GYP8_9GAMM|nr:hydrolase [Pelagibaculum spongiae]PVZ72201.1 hypothetical protein DC094_04075 [Pelagibaculum spongiae]